RDAGGLNHNTTAGAIDSADIAPSLDHQPLRHQFEVGCADDLFQLLKHRSLKPRNTRKKGSQYDSFPFNLRVVAEIHQQTQFKTPGSEITLLLVNDVGNRHKFLSFSSFVYFVYFVVATVGPVSADRATVSSRQK